MYKDLKEIYDKTRMDMFVMAVTYLVDVGHRNVKEITDEQIENMKGNPFMTEEYVRALVTKARDIANCIDTPTEIIQFCQAEKVFDTQFYKKGR